MSSVLTPEPEVPHSHLAMHAPALLSASISDEQLMTVAERRKRIRARRMRRRRAARQG